MQQHYQHQQQQQQLLLLAASSSSSDAFNTMANGALLIEQQKFQQQQKEQQQETQHLAREKEKEEEEAQRCAVCADQAQGLHFGVIVCRACAAFFRRSTIAARVYQCRYDGNCQIDHLEIRCSCRACRMARCIALGMDPNAVQKHRDKIGLRNAMGISNNGATSTTTSKIKSSNNNKDNKIINNRKGKKNGGGRAAQKMGEEKEEKEEERFEKAARQPIIPQSLLAPLSLMSAPIKSIASSSQQQEPAVFHCENGRSYALLGNVIGARPNANNTNDVEENQQQQQIQRFSEALLQALPSAFSPIQKQQLQQQFQQNSPLNAIKNKASDSGNSSANSSAFSSPLNPGSAASSHSRQNQSPSNVLSAASSHSELKLDSWWAFDEKPGTSQILLSSLPSTSKSGTIAQANEVAQSRGQKSCCSIISEMLVGYQKLVKSRKRIAKQPAAAAADGGGGGVHSSTIGCEGELILVEGNYEANIESIKTDFVLFSEMIDDLFPMPETEFSPSTRWSLLQSFFSSFIIAERLYISAQHFKNPEDTRLVCSSNFAYMDVRRLDRFFSVEQCRTEPENIAKVFEPVFWKFIKLMRQPMVQLRLTEREFIGLIGMLFWNDRVDSLNEEERLIVSQKREKIFEELYELCRIEGGEAAAGNRYYTLLNLFHFCQKTSLEVSNNYTLINAVQKFDFDAFLHQFMQQSF